MRRILFHRDFRSYTGGHGKVRDYFQHALAHPAWSPSVYLTPESTDDDNPWIGETQRRVGAWRPAEFDALFLGGMDWLAGTDHVPVVNLIQHVRHADAGTPLHEFLSRPAIRICVSKAVADAIAATGRVNGPIHVIPAAIDLEPAKPSPKTGSIVFIGAQKQPALGRRLADALRSLGHAVVLGDRWVTRERYLGDLREAAIAVLLPDAREGFYLPGLEAMALGCAVVVPDCIGNREYVRPEVNALAPPPTIAALCAAVESLRDPGRRQALVEAGVATATRFAPAQERRAFHGVLDRLLESL